MNIRTEIDKYANPDNRAVLHWLFDRYRLASQWRFVASCSFDRYGSQSYEVNRVWQPTAEGLALYAQLSNT